MLLHAPLAKASGDGRTKSARFLSRPSSSVRTRSFNEPGNWPGVIAARAEGMRVQSRHHLIITELLGEVGQVREIVLKLVIASLHEQLQQRGGMVHR